MVRAFIVAAGITSLIAAGLRGQPARSDHAATPAPATAPADALRTGIDVFPAPDNRVVRAQLGRQLPKFEVKDQRFEDAVAAFRRLTELNLEVDWKSLEGFNVDKDARINLSLNNVTIRDALASLLAQVNSPTGTLQFYIDRNIVHIHCGYEGVPVFLRIYDIADILLSERTRWRVLHPPPATLPSTSPVNPAVAQPEDDISPDQLVENLTKLLMELVAPDTWRETGGMVGSIREFNGRLLISTTEQAHERIEEVLAVLRKKGNLPAMRP